MPTFRPLWVGPLLILGSVSPLLGQVPSKAVTGVVTAGKTAVSVTKTSPRALKAIKQMSTRLTENGITAAIQITNLPTMSAGESHSKLGKYGHLQTGWAGRTQLAQLTQDLPNFTPTQTAQVLLDNNLDAIGELAPQQQEYLRLAHYPAAAIESPLVLSDKQVAQALVTYTQIIENTPILSRNNENYIETWGKLMSAMTNIGLFATAEQADLVLKGAQKIRYGILMGPTDVIAVRSLLNLQAYEKIQELADYRLNTLTANGSSLVLPYEWGEIMQYMQQAGLPLTIAPNRIAPAAEKPVLYRLPTAQAWLGYYNSYNLFHADPSAQTTKDWLDLRKGIQEKANAATISAHMSELLPALPSKKGTTLVLPTITGSQKPNTAVNPQTVPPIIAKHFGIPPQTQTAPTSKTGPIVLSIVSASPASEVTPASMLFTPLHSQEEAEALAVQTHTPEQLSNIAKQQDRLLQNIQAGKIHARYNTTPFREFYPYEQALARATSEMNRPMITYLERAKEITQLTSSNWKEISGQDADISEGRRAVTQLQKYIEDTAAMMFMGYSWGEKPLREIIVPSQYHSQVFNTTLAGTKNLTEALKGVFAPKHNLQEAQQQATKNLTGKQLMAIARQQDKLVSKIIAGNIHVRYEVSPGQGFYPYEQALARARATSNQAMVDWLVRAKDTSNLVTGNWRKIAGKQASREEAAYTISQIQEYIENTTFMMFLGYSWGETPLHEILVPASYHSQEFNDFMNEFSYQK